MPSGSELVWRTVLIKMSSGAAAKNTKHPHRRLPRFSSKDNYLPFIFTINKREDFTHSATKLICFQFLMKDDNRDVFSARQFQFGRTLDSSRDEAVFKVFTNVCSRRISQLPPLFDGCFFFLLGSFKTPTKDELTKLLREGGAQLLNRQPKPDSDVTQTVNATAYHALPGSDQAICTHYIIYDPQAPHKPSVVRRGKVWSAPTTWVINCITAFSLLPVPDPELLV